MKRLIVVLAAVGMAGCALLNKPCVGSAPGPGYVCVAGAWVPTEQPPVTCATGQHVENGVCVADPVTPPADPCTPNPCAAGQTCKVGESFPPVAICTSTIPPPIDCRAALCAPGSHCEQGKGCIPDAPPPPTAVCPVKLPDISAQTINARCMNLNPDGKCRTDATGRVGDRGNDEGYCGVVTGNPAIHSCKVNPEGAGLTGCDEQFWQAKCALWFYSVDGGHVWKRCLPDGDGATQEFSCDHFDDYTDTAGAYFGTCDRGPSGGPISGYHMVPHGRGKVRACKVDQSVCSDAIDINF